ncbi:hypothetical protein LTR66_009093 [Elasticomyces elasticus]|nr:hypothetical protein LTR66_009093 [Elasticomyces elasticus]
MALAKSSSEYCTEQKPSPRDVIFSCAICQATLSDIYAKTESNPGIRNGCDSDHSIATKLWLTDCGHLTCSKHLEGGGAPFHPEHQSPRALCPWCAARGDRELKSLYSIRGYHEGEYDKVIPKDWFEAPPIKMDSSVPGMEGLRFQYLSLLNYSRSVTVKLTNGRNEMAALAQKLAEETAERRNLEIQSQDLLRRLKDLQKAELELNKWKRREPAIHHYLQVVNKMSMWVSPQNYRDNSSNFNRELNQMREQLTLLGYEVPNNSYTFKPLDDGHDYSTGKQTSPSHDTRRHDNRRAYGSGSATRQTETQSTGTLHARSSSSRTPHIAHGQEDIADAVATAHDVPEPLHARKRKYEEFDTDKTTQRMASALRVRGGSRQQMPPPARPGTEQVTRHLPVSRGGVRVKSPLVQQNHAGITKLPRLQERPVSVHQNDDWQDARVPMPDESVRGGVVRGQNVHQSPLMSGALPPPSPQYRVQNKQRASGHPTSRHNNALYSDGTRYNGGPIRRQDYESLQRSHHDLEEPLSYLPRKNHVIDPTGEASATAVTDSPMMHYDHSYDIVARERQQYEQPLQNPFPAEWIRQPSKQVFEARRVPPLHFENAHEFRRKPFSTANRNRFGIPSTPSLQKTSHPNAPELSSVVSPFFKSGRGAPQRQLTRAQHPQSQQLFAQQLGSRSIAHVNHTVPAQPNWNEPRSLNGLSFIEDPRMQRNHYPLLQGPSPSRSQFAERLAVPATPRDSRGLFRRLDAAEGAYGEARAPPRLERHELSAAQAPRTPYLPTSKQSLFPLYNPPRDRAPRDELAAVMGVKAPATTSRAGLFSAAGGRRSVRR